MLLFLRSLTLFILTLLILPFLLILAATLLLLNLLTWPFRLSRRRSPEKVSPLSGLATIIILNWNGKDLLAQGLPSVLEAVRVDGRPHEILVVDNGSCDGSLEFLEESFPQISVLSLPKNVGFAEGNNAGVREAKNDIVVLLNNDMVVGPAFLRPLLDGFGTDTFAVSSQIYLQDPSARREETGKTIAVFRRGMIDYSHAPLEHRALSRPYYPAFWAGGGSSAFHRRRFLALGGFQRIYSPAYVEDTDLCYAAWKSGWEVLFAPSSVVYHKHRASSSRRFSPIALQCLIQRNQFLFIWKNIHSWRFLFLHCAFLPWNCYRLGRDHGLRIWQSLIQAAARIPSALIAQTRFPFCTVRSDHWIFEMVSQPYRYSSKLRTNRNEAAAPMAASAGPNARPSVLWITAYLPHTGRHAGAGRMLQLLSRISRRYRITLLTFLERDEERKLLPEAQALCEKVVALRRIPPPRWNIFAYEPFDEFRTPEMQEAVGECLAESDYDLIQLEYSQMACYADSSLGVPTLLTKHEVDFAACGRRARLSSNLGTRLRWFYNYLQVLDREIRLLKRVDAAICMTEPDAGELRKFCSSIPIHVVNTGVDLEYFQPPDQVASAPRLVFVGAFQHDPNVEAMLYFCREVFPLVCKEIPNCELVIVGSNPPPPVLSLADVPGVQVTGFVPDIRPYMANSAVYIVPLRLGVGIRGKILEAWAMGMAVVATSVACAGLRFEHGRNLLLSDSSELFASQVVQLLRDPALRERLGREGRETAEKFYGWDASAEQLDSLYRRYMKDYGKPFRRSERRGRALAEIGS